MMGTWGQAPCKWGRMPRRWDHGDGAIGMGPWGQVLWGWRKCPHALRQPGMAVLPRHSAWVALTQPCPLGSPSCPGNHPRSLSHGCRCPRRGSLGTAPAPLPLGAGVPVAAAPTQHLSPSFQPKPSASLVSPCCWSPTLLSTDTAGGRGRLASSVTLQVPSPASSCWTPPGHRCSCQRR